MRMLMVWIIELLKERLIWKFCEVFKNCSWNKIEVLYMEFNMRFLYFIG